MSRADLAQRAGVNVQTIGALERCQYYPSLDLAMRLAEIFGLPIEAMFSREPFPPLSSQLYPESFGGRT